MIDLGMPDLDSQAHGKEELPGEESGSGGNARLDIDHLLGQDGHVDPEPNDRRSHVVRQPHRRSRYH